MTEKQADEFVRSKLEDYLKKMGQKPDQAGRYHCIAKDHTDGNPSMTIHKSGTYAMCWSHPSPKDTFNIYDAIGIFEGLHSLRAQKQRAYAIYGLTIDETSATQPEKKGNDVKSVAPETPAPGKHKQPKAAPLQHAVAVPPPDMRTVAKQPVWPAPAKAAPPPAAAVTAEQPVKHPEENIAKSDEKLQIPQLVAKKDEALERSVAKPETQMTEKPVPADTPAPPQASSPTKPEAPKPVKPEDMPILSVTPVAAKPPLPPPAAVPPAHAEKPKPISPIPETKFEEKIEVP
ncbi:MAG: hypothetical protein GX112_13030, partial [Clostridiaceae bacterium]|nr:hypothetical protein [Clostridiaceae bacterium]